MNRIRSTYRFFRVARRVFRGWHFGATTNSIDYTYDRLYRLTVRSAERFAYNRHGEMASAAYSNGTLVVSNRYDHLGRRVVKIAPDVTHTFLYDSRDEEWCIIHC